MSDEDIIWTSGRALVERMRAGDLSAREVTAAFLDRIESLEPSLRSFISVNRDGAMEQARLADDAQATGDTTGRLHGLPIGVKDNLWTRDMPTTASSKLFADYMAPSDGLPVERIRAAGGVVVGKTHLPEFAAWPRTVSLIRQENRNPWNLEHVTGASSGGSGSAAAAAQVPVTLGTDGGGSTRIPAALNGVVGVQPSKGIVPAWGQVGYGAFGAVGPMCRDVRDAAMLLTVISGPDDRDPASSGTVQVDYERSLDDGVDGISVAWLDAMGDFEPNAAINAVVRSAVDDLAQAGLRFTERADRFNGLAEHFLPLNVGRHLYDGGPPSPLQEPAVLAAAADPQRRDELLTPYILASLDAAPAVSRKTWETSVAWATECERRLAGVFDEFDLIVCPTTQYTAPRCPHDDWSMPFESIGEYVANTGLVNVLGLTGVSVPCGFLEGLPVGLQIIGPRSSEALALRIARALEQVRPWAHLKPELGT